MDSTTLEHPVSTSTSALTSTLIPLSDSNLTLAEPDADIRGREVLDQNGEELGEVDDLLVDDSEHLVRFLKVKSGGFLGIGAEMTFIPVDAVTKITENTVQVSLTREHISGAPRYNPEVVQEPDHYSDLYGYYGFQPYWGTGYMYPPFPNYGTGVL